MTEDEKKEFEEFLKWKAEKAQQAKETEQTSEPEKVIENAPQQVIAPPENTKSSSDVEKGYDNKGLYIMGAAVFAIIILLLIVALSGKKRDAQSALPVEETIIDVDTVAVAEADEHFSMPTKVLWNFNIEKDEMTDSKNIWASIISDNYISQDFPYEGRTRASIIVRYMKKYGYDVLIQITDGQINGRDYYGTNYITARFDENSPKKYFFNESADGDSKIVFLRNSTDFIKRCKKAKNIKIDLPLYKGGRPVFTYHVDEPLVWREE